MSAFDEEPQELKPSDVVTLGTHAVRALVLEAREAINEPSTAKATVAVGSVANRPADYRSTARIQVSSGHVLFGGWVIQARPEGDTIVLEMSNGPALSEYRFDELTVVGVHPSEMVWSLAQIAGFKPESLHIGGLVAVSEAIVTVLPLSGLALGSDSQVGPVRLTVDRPLIELAARSLPDSPAKARLLQADGWAIARGVASFLLPAEMASVRLIEAAIDRIALEAQYSLACNPDGRALPFARDALRSDPIATRLALVHGEASGRTWLRTLDNAPVVLPLAERRIDVSGTIGETALDSAIRAWRRAVRARDAIGAAGALFESIEFYVGGLTLPPIVPRAKCRAIRRALKNVALTEPEQKRLDDALGWINRPPLKVRLVAALERDQVPYSDEEIEALWRLRGVRNEALHGASAADPKANDVEIGRALVNRMLVFRAWGHADRGG